MAGVGRSATVGFGGRDQPGEITPQFAPRSPARRRSRCQSIGRGSQRTHMTPAAMTASRGGGQMQVLVSRVHSDNRVQKGQTHLDGHPAVSTEVRQRLDSEIAEETGVALARVRERFALLTGTGEVITCKLTRFENGKPVDTCLYRASGYSPPPAPGRKPKPPA